MYEEVSIEALSPAQMSRMRNGHGVKVKVGSGLKIHLSAQQMKKLKRGHSKGSAVVLHMDPFQQEHLKGMKGRALPIMHEEFTGNDVAHFIGAKKSSDPLMNEKVSLGRIKDTANEVKGRVGKFFGMGVRKRGRPKKGGDILGDVNHFFTRTVPSTLIHKGIPATASFLGGVATPQFGGVGSIPAGIAGAKLAEEVGRKTGYGVKRKGKGVLGSTFDKMVAEAIGEENKRVGYELLKEKALPAFERGLEKAKDFAVKNGLPLDVSDSAENIVKSYVRNPSRFQKKEKIVEAVKSAVLTGSGVKKSEGGIIKRRRAGCSRRSRPRSSRRSNSSGT